MQVSLAAASAARQGFQAKNSQRGRSVRRQISAGRWETQHAPRDRDLPAPKTGTDRYGPVRKGYLIARLTCYAAGRTIKCMGVPAREAMEPAAVERNVFSTVGLPAARRIERWESHNAAALIGLDVRSAGPLEATEVNVRLPAVRLARVRGSAHAVERTPKVIARCPADSIAIYLTLRGDASFAS